MKKLIVIIIILAAVGGLGYFLYNTMQDDYSKNYERLSKEGKSTTGTITSMEDLRALEHRGLAGCVIGMALYTGALDPVVVAGEFGQ